MEDWLSRDRINTMTTVVEQGSFSKAAAVLGVGQAAVGQQVRRLEAELGRSLFDRTRRGLSLTSDGEAYMMFAQAVSGLGIEARRHFGQPRIAGALRLGVAEEFTRTMLMRVLVAFKRLFPDYEVKIVCDASHRLLIGADEGDYDIVVAKGPVTRGRSDVIRRVSLAWVGPAGLRDPVPDPVPLVLFAPPDPFREIALRALRDAGRTWRVQLETTLLTAMEAAVAAGFGISVAAKPLPLNGVAFLDGAAELPILDDFDIVFLRMSASGSVDEGVVAMQAIIESVFDAASEADYHRPRDLGRGGGLGRHDGDRSV